jgi:hypothetical protein
VNPREIIRRERNRVAEISVVRLEQLHSSGGRGGSTYSFDSDTPTFRLQGGPVGFDPRHGGSRVAETGAWVDEGSPHVDAVVEADPKVRPVAMQAETAVHNGVSSLLEAWRGTETVADGP